MSRARVWVCFAVIFITYTYAQLGGEEVPSSEIEDLNPVPAEEALSAVVLPALPPGSLSAGLGRSIGGGEDDEFDPVEGDWYTDEQGNYVQQSGSGFRRYRDSCYGGPDDCDYYCRQGDSRYYYFCRWHVCRYWYHNRVSHNYLHPESCYDYCYDYGWSPYSEWCYCKCRYEDSNHSNGF